MKKPTTVKDKAAPEVMLLELKDKHPKLPKQNGQKMLFTAAAALRQFDSGSTGYYFSGKVHNLDSGLSYQLNGTLILDGSKPKDAKKKPEKKKAKR